MNDDVLAIGKWVNNGDMIADVARLGYLPEPVLDTTFAKGVFWKRHRPGTLVTNDLDPQYRTDLHFDVRDLPFDDATFPCVVFDPPYKLNGTSTGRGASAADARYGVTRYASTATRHGLLFDGITECARVLTPGGYLLVKVQDSVSGGRVRWQTDYATDHAETRGLRLVDSFLYMGRRKQPEGRGQVHARRNYSTLLVFRKTGLPFPTLAFTPDAIRQLVHDHTPANQDGNGYDRCALCSYTRHPCDIYQLAADWLTLNRTPLEGA